MKANFTRDRQDSKGAVADAGQLVEDQFSKLWSDRTREPAKVAMTVSESLEYGALKVSATVSLACDQNETTINKAGDLAFHKALELVRDGFKEMQGG